MVAAKRRSATFSNSAVVMLVAALSLLSPSPRHTLQPTPHIAQMPHKLALLFRYEPSVAHVINQLTGSADRHVSDFIQLYKWRQKALPPEQEDTVCGDEVFDDESKMSTECLELLMEQLVGNPIQVFNLMWRWAKLIPAIVKTPNPQCGRLVELTKDVGITEDDLLETMEALVRIQFAYRLDPYDLAKGLIMGIQTQVGLTAGQLVDIAGRCVRGELKTREPYYSGQYHSRYYALAVEWVEAALKLIQEEEEVSPDLVSEARDLLLLATALHDIYWKPPQRRRGVLPNEEFFHQKLHFPENASSTIVTEDSTRSSQEVRRPGRTLRLQETEFLRRNPEPPTNEMAYNSHALYALCRGEEVDESPVRRAAKVVIRTQDRICKMDSSKHPSLLLAPLKVEVLSAEPEVFILHNILTNKEMNYIKKEALNTLQASPVLIKTPAGVVTSDRSQSSCWIFDETSEPMYKLSKRISLATGLNVHRPESSKIYYSEAEAWQVGVYSPGGHYVPHFDDLGLHEGHPNTFGFGGIYIGDRIATSLFYLSDLVGGLTAFVDLGIAAHPSKGSMLFWYNKNHDGSRNLLSYHTACPTVLGIKWVSNKWIREGAQLWKKPCRLRKI